MKPLRALLLFVCALSLPAFAPQNPIGPEGKPVPVPLTEDPYHKLLFENEHARVFEVAIPAQKTTLLHKHDGDFVSVELTDIDFEFAFRGFSLMTWRNQFGDVRFTHGPTTHQMRNPEGLATYRNITVEVRKPSTQPYRYPYTGSSVADYDALPLPVEPGKSYVVSLDRDTVRMTGVQILPSETQSFPAGQGPLLVVALTDLELSATVEEGKKEVRMKRGEVQWEPREFRHKLTNPGREPVRFVVLEFK
jgi:ribosomal protein L25 (general stress protein Ctc)